MRYIAFIFILSFFISCNSNDKRPLIGETEYQQTLNASFKDATSSPLKKKDLKNFKGLDFFPVDSSFIVLSTFTKIENSPIFKMPTNTGRTTDINPDGTFILNFNNSYNPYCAYNEKFSCPLTPRKNHLDIEIKAGVKSFKK